MKMDKINPSEPACGNPNGFRASGEARPHREYCSWCGQLLYLLPDKTWCGKCDEDEVRLTVEAHNARMDRRPKSMWKRPGALKWSD